MSEAPRDVRELAERRADARAAKDFTQADALREAIAEAGWTVVDGPGGWSLEPAATPAPEARPLRAQDVPSVLGEPATADISLHWVCEGWPDDIARAVDGGGDGDRRWRSGSAPRARSPAR